MPSNSDSNTTLYNNGQKVDPQSLQFFRALQDPEKGNEICKKILNDCTARTGKDAAIMRKYNDEQPWNQKELEAAGQGWRNNRSTGFMSSLIRRAIHPYKQTVDLAKYLTNSELPEAIENWSDKSEKFQMETTRTVRGWSGFDNFNFMTILEDVIFGHAQVVWTDTIDWRPKAARSDDCVFPDGASQTADDIPLMVLKQVFFIHQLAKYLKNPEISKAAGWNIDNLVKAINDAQPENRQKGTPENARKIEDTIRESTLGRTYSQGVNVVEASHLFIQEASGKVSHYLYNAKNSDILFKYEDQYESMRHALATFSLEVGNGTIYGSKGAGRVLYNTHVAIEQSRNLIADALYLSGLIVLKATTGNKKKVALTVTHPFAVIGDGYEVIEFKFEADYEAFEKLDRHTSSLAEIQVGIFMPGIVSSTGDAKGVTASAVNYVAQVEQQIKEGVLARFKRQYYVVVFEIQRRIYSEDNIKSGIGLYNLRKQTGIKLITQRVMGFIERITAFVGGKTFTPPKVPNSNPNDPSQMAAEAIANLLEGGLSPTEIFILANTPPDKFTEDPVDTNPQNMDSVAAKYGADPDVDKEELKKMDIGQKLGKKVAERLVIPGIDQTILAEATRLQIMENVPLATGEDVPVSPRDAHIVHMDTIMETYGKVLQTLNIQSVTQASLDINSKFMTHFDQHLQGALSAGSKPEDLKEYMEFNDTAKKLQESLQGQLPNTPQGGGAKLPEGAMPLGEAMKNGQAPTTNALDVPLGAIGNAAAAASNKPLSRQPADTTAKPI